MAHWLDEYPALRVMHKLMDAEIYNRIRFNVLREHRPWRLSLKAFRCLACILEERIWICVDECQNDQPIMAWTNFQIAQRDALDAPIDCDLYLYHMHAGLIMGSALEMLAKTVADHAKRLPHAELPVSVLKS